MSGPRAAVRITLTAQHLDTGWVSSDALREVHDSLYDAPAGALVFVDLGPLRRVDDGLVRTLSLLPCAPHVRFESRWWRLANDTALALLNRLIPVVGVTR